MSIEIEIHDDSIWMDGFLVANLTMSSHASIRQKFETAVINLQELDELQVALDEEKDSLMEEQDKSLALEADVEDMKGQIKDFKDQLLRIGMIVDE